MSGRPFSNTDGFSTIETVIALMIALAAFLPLANTAVDCLRAADRLEARSLSLIAERNGKTDDCARLLSF